MHKNSTHRYCATLIKPLSALLLSPLVASAASAAAVLIFSALISLKLTLPLLLGAAAYFPFHFWMPRSRYLYVLAHELSHAIAAIITGVKVKKIKVNRTGGYVTMESANTFVSLAPYFTPFYAVLAAAIYALAGFFWDLSAWRALFTGTMGFMLSFHLFNTFDILAGPVQSDIKKAGGICFSFSIILLVNSVCLLLILKALFPDLISLRSYAQQVYSGTSAIISWLAWAVFWLYNTARIYS